MADQKTVRNALLITGEAHEAYNVQDPVLNNTLGGEDVVNGALAEAREKIAAIAKAS